MRPSSISSRLAIALHICHAHGVAFSVRLPSSLKAGFSPFIRPKIAALSCLCISGLAVISWIHFSVLTFTSFSQFTILSSAKTLLLLHAL